MITVEEWLRQNKIPNEGIESFRTRMEYRNFLLAQSAGREDAEVATLDRKTNKMIFMKRINNISLQVDTTLTRVFLIGIDSWQRMKDNNLWNEHLLQNQGDNHDD